ncbi:sperm-associated antigen 16 protein isoform X2 [Saccopteryx leptura]|uniref:sperm-associated antigen 16 protein isoform X2 n=1 Tax=Saccopteryx leptura TaxID=249018 RepID=UPI00339BF25D
MDAVDRRGTATQSAGMAAQQGRPASPLRALEEALGMHLTAEEAADAVATDGTYYLEQVTIAEASEDECEYEEIPDDNFSIPEGEEDLTKAMQMAQEQVTDTQILEQKIVLPSKPVGPEAIEDFLCNFLIRMGMTRTLDCFQSEWYELMQKGVTELKDAGNVPDVYSQLMQLETEKQNLKKELKRYKQAAELKLHYASYEPTIRVLLEKHQTLLKQKMLTSLQRDRAAEQRRERERRGEKQEASTPIYALTGQAQGFEPTTSAFQVNALSTAPPQITGFRATGRHKGLEHSYQVPICRVVSGYKKESAPEGRTQKALPEAREQTKWKRDMKDNAKDSEFPTYKQQNPNPYLCEGKYGPAKFDYKLNTILRLHELPVSCIRMHPREDILISCGEDHVWKKVGVPGGNVLFTGTGHTDWLSSCCFHPSGNKLATSSGDTTVKLWDMSKGNCILTFEGHKQAVWSCTWHSCDDIVASSSLDNTSKIWDVNSGRCKCTLYGHTESVNSIEFCLSSNTLLTGSTDKSLSIWDARTGKCEQSLYGHMHSINDATFTPRGHIIASCDSCGVIKLWDFRKLLPIVSIDVGPSPGNEVNFDQSGQVLAQASGSGIIHLLDLKSGKIHKLVGHENEVHTVVFSQRGESLFSGDSDGTVRIWS